MVTIKEMIYIKDNSSLNKGIGTKIIAIVTIFVVTFMPICMVLNANSFTYKDNLLISCTTEQTGEPECTLDSKISRIAEQKIKEQNDFGEIVEWKFDKESFINEMKTANVSSNVNSDLEQKIKNCIKISYAQYELAIDNDTTFYFKSEKEAHNYKDKIESKAEIAKTIVDSVKVTSQADLDNKYAEITQPIVVAKVNVNKPKVTSRGGNISRTTNKGILPIKSYVYISSGYRTAHRPNHTGVDFAAYYGTPILAWKSGTVIRASWNGGYGNCIEVDHGNGYVTRYAHCSSYNVKVGQTVAQGSTLGFVGSTGNSTGNHLHFEVMINGTFNSPMNYIQ